VRCLDPDPMRIQAFNTSQTLFTVVQYKKVQHFADSIKFCNPFMVFLLDEDLEFDLELDPDWFERSAPDPVPE
jgi:hypothetical protein